MIERRVRLILNNGGTYECETLADADEWLEKVGLTVDDVADWTVVWYGTGEDTYEYRVAPTG